MTEKVVKIYSDGACSGNPGPGGWGAVLMSNGHQKEISGSEPDTTNNRMELKAAIMALRALKSPNNIRVEVYTDSSYVKNGITKWIKTWKQNGWNKGKVKNIDLWQELDEIASKFAVEWHWIKGHSGNEGNELADKLATEAIKR